MIPRYEDQRVVERCKLLRKYQGWQRTEFAVIWAREQLKRIVGVFKRIKDLLTSKEIDTEFIKEREKVLNHDLNAFIEERLRHLPVELHQDVHKDMTSYDTEEAEFVSMLSDCCGYVMRDAYDLCQSIANLARKYRYTPMNARTHGQEAELQSFGKRCLTWYKDLNQAYIQLGKLLDNLSYCKLSGAIGTNSGIDPELERVALEHLNLKPWPGATQIMPRILYAPIAQAIANLVIVIDKIATDIRLAARSGRPLMQEPFGKSQKGSSAMPHKKNTIDCENTEGMAILAKSYALALTEIIKTWEERAIAQSSVERVAWPDLFQVALRAIKNTKKVVDGLRVYPDIMILEIIESRGTYASNAAKEFLTSHGGSVGLSREDCYRIVQLASFNVFKPTLAAQKLRDNPPISHNSADQIFYEVREYANTFFSKNVSIEKVIKEGFLHVHPELAPTEGDVTRWNEALRKLFSSSEIESKWSEVFFPSKALQNEDYLFEAILGKEK